MSRFYHKLKSRGVIPRKYKIRYNETAQFTTC